MILDVYTCAAMFVRGSIFPDNIIAVNVYNRVINMLFQPRLVRFHDASDLDV